MGAPTSSIWGGGGIYLQYLENTKLFNILMKLHIVVYSRYVNDILVVYHGSTTNIHEVSNVSNGMTS